MVIFFGVMLISTAGWMVSLLSPRSAARRHLVLIAALAACALLPLAAGVRWGTRWTLVAVSSRPGQGELVNPQAAAAPGNALERDTPQHESADDDAEPAPTIVAAPTIAPAPNLHAAQTSVDESIGRGGSISMTTWVAAIYGLVAGVLMLRLIASMVALARLKRRATETDARTDGVRILEADVAVPLAVGFGRLAIVLPRGFRAAVGAGELQDVLAHEAEHLRRKDHWVMLLQEAAAAVYWPIVTVHLLNRALVRAREELCDNAVLAAREPAAYCRTLLSVAERARRGRRTIIAQLAPSVLRRGELERRVALALDGRRDRRTGVGRRISWTVAATLIAAMVLGGTTRLVAVAEEPPASDSAVDASATNATTASIGSIDWTGLPKVDMDHPALHRGVVLGPDGKPLAGASVYAASTIELLEMADEAKATVEALGSVRAVTDAEGRFQFVAEDLTWVTPAGVRERWETLLVATKDGVAPGWLKTWGADRGFREHWHPWQDREVAIQTRPPAPLTGRLTLEGGAPLSGAGVQLAALMAPVKYDLNVHIPQEEVNEVGLFGTIDYAEQIYRPQVLPGLVTEATTDDDGRFELPGLPEGFIANIEITHPKAVTTTLRVAIRAIEPVYIKRSHGGDAPAPSPTLYGSGFTTELAQGTVLRGHVIDGSASGNKPVAGIGVAYANHNAKQGWWGQQFKTDADGRFEVTGLAKQPRGYELAFVGSFAAPFASHRQQVVPGDDGYIKLQPAVPYRLKLVDAKGEPIDREVTSIQVQATPGDIRSGITSRFNDAERIGPGVYEGIVPLGPGAVLVKRGAKADRPAAVDPKAFFAPNRKDWTPEEQRYAYGDAWRIAQTPIVTTDGLSVGANWTVDQLGLAAVAFTYGRTGDGVLELTATVASDVPVQVTLVDEAGAPVTDARVERQLDKYNGEGLPATFAVYGLHPQRPELLRFSQEQRSLIGTLSTTWTSEPLRVVMRPAATLLGRIVDASGELSSDFGIRVVGEGLAPDTFVGGRVFNTTEKPGERKGEFRLDVPPGTDVRGEWIRRAQDQLTRPSAGAAFGPVAPKPGETLNFGDLVAP